MSAATAGLTHRSALDPSNKSPLTIRARRSVANDFHQWAAILTAQESLQTSSGPVNSADRSPVGPSVFEIFSAGCPAGIARQETEDENTDEEEDNRVNGDLEGEHGDRPSSVIASASYGECQRYPGRHPPSGRPNGVD